MTEPFTPPHHEGELTGAGLAQLDGRALLSSLRALPKIIGFYQPPFTFTGGFNPDGTMHGVNNFGTCDNGRWETKGDTLHLFWRGGWDNTITHAYRVEPFLHFFDVETGNWRMSVTPA